jgi:hypothetical protein
MATSAVPTLAARFESPEQARAAIERLENSGVDGTDIELLGSGADDARRPRDPGPQDRRLGRYLVPRVLSGAALGGVAGVALGAAVGTVVSVMFDASIGVAVYCAVFGLFAGSTIGAYVRYERTVGFSNDWSATFVDTHGKPLWVAVRARDESTFDRARNALQTVDAIEVRSEERADRRSRRR